MTSVLDHLLGQGSAFLVLPAPAAMTPGAVVERHGLDPAELVWTELVITGDGPVAMAVAAGRSLDLDSARAAVRDPGARLATHEEARAFAHGCEIGAIPPLANFLGAPVIVDAPIAALEHVVFPAGVTSALVCMRREDLFAAEPVRVASISGDPGAAAAPAHPPLGLIAPTRRAAFTGEEPLIPYHLRAG
jgi:prolyl-tRNA editing enzyme YbaK/EbsC (Cys-tRNA(Pro) deacylase)